MLMLLATSVSLRANPTQDRNVTGLVTSATDGEPVIGASVQVKGTGKGTITDLNGRYTVSAAPGQTLVFSYVGFKTQEIKVGQQTTLNVVLTEDSELLEEVVVVGYGSMKRSDLTGSVTSVGSTAIEKSVPTNIDQVLQGRAAGVQIQADTGLPGGSSTIRIRGMNSLNATSQPILSSTVSSSTPRAKTMVTPTPYLPSTRAILSAWTCSRMPRLQPSTVRVPPTV